ncbi:coth protein-domain-containing protein [Halteromyces radiatus]|uniref:coth protein-domain-containing protein n=1 Tax=Halteromyces radiatus TaxID=101107 RepID=UPI002220CA9C|nr:coth protein-domain-containing protein [Halteromyces radiatus]KAI8099765.1 coth protein-domain-containing protein [Halteromyces radiatus]
MIGSFISFFPREKLSSKQDQCQCDQQENIEYNVVVNSMTAQMMVGVAVGNQVYPLLQHESVPFLYQGWAPGKKSYRYVMLDSIDPNTVIDYEPFERAAIFQSDRTFNEVYGRPWNKLTLPVLPKVYDFELGPDSQSNLNQQHQDLGDSKLYEDGVIANLIFQFDEADVDQLHLNKMNLKAKIKGQMTFISYDNIQQFDDVSLKVGGHSSRTWAKVPYKLKIKSPNGLYNRWSLKMRPEATDPTLIREKLYSDVLQASGVLAPRGAYVRVYFNGRAAGLYLLTDDTVEQSYLQETIHHGSSNARIGPIIKGDAGKGEYAADLLYRGDSPESYDPKVYEVKPGNEPNSPDPMEGLVELTRFIAAYDISTAPKDAAAFDEWNKMIDVKHFLRQVACEWLGGNWDGLVYSGNNFMLYRHPDTKQYITLPMDFDFTFGNGLEIDQHKLMTGNWIDFSADRMVHSYLWEKVIEIPYFQQMYMDTLQTINAKVMDPAIIIPRIEGLAYMIEHDAEWDRSLDRMSEGGESRNWPDNIYLQSLERGFGAEDENIGLKEFIRVKFEAVKKDLASLEIMTPEEKQALMYNNAIYIKGIPRETFEEMEEETEEELGENAQDLIINAVGTSQNTE